MSTREQYPIARANSVIPWFVMERRRAQAYVNFGLTLEQLADRGGTTWVETQCILENRANAPGDVDAAKRRVMQIVNREVARKEAQA